MKHLKLAALAAATCLAAAPAAAASLDFTITGDTNISFTLDSNPAPSGWSANPASPGFLTSPIPVLVNGTTITTKLAFRNTGTDGPAIVLEIGDSSAPVFQATGPDLFSGPVTAPTIKPGSFALASVSGGKSYTLKIVDPAASAVPEPATWALMIGGFGLAGTALRRRRTSVAYA